MSTEYIDHNGRAYEEKKPRTARGTAAKTEVPPPSPAPAPSGEEPAKLRPRKLRIEEMEEISKRASAKALRDSDSRFREIAQGAVAAVVTIENAGKTAGQQILQEISEGTTRSRGILTQLASNLDYTRIVDGVVTKLGGVAGITESLQRRALDATQVRTIAARVLELISYDRLAQDVVARCGGVEDFVNRVEQSIHTRVQDRLLASNFEIDRIRAEAEEFLVDRLMTRPGFRDEVIERAATKIAERTAKRMEKSAEPEAPAKRASKAKTEARVEAK